MAFREYLSGEQKMFFDDQERYDYLKECFCYGYKLPDSRTIEKYFKDSESTAEYTFQIKEHDSSWIIFKKKIRILKEIQIQEEKTKT